MKQKLLFFPWKSFYCLWGGRPSHRMYLLVNTPNRHGDVPLSKSSLGSVTCHACWFADYQCTDTRPDCGRQLPRVGQDNLPVLVLTLSVLFKSCCGASRGKQMN